MYNNRGWMIPLVFCICAAVTAAIIFFIRRREKEVEYEHRPTKKNILVNEDDDGEYD